MTPPSPTRREFLRRASSFVAAVTLFPRPGRAGSQVPLDATDEKIIRERLGMREDRKSLSMGDLVAAVGQSFLGKPYRANTLEKEGEERLVVNLREFDCVTLCEASLALARSVRLRADSTRAYCEQLQNIRYRGGVINGYGSRLHYFSEWIADNEKKHVVRNITEGLGGERDGRPLNFMTTHRDAYPRLAGDADFSAIVGMEKTLESVPRFVVPKEKVEGILGRIQSGDIIAITTSIPGLDVTHTGIALRLDGTTRLLHAPNVGQNVQITSGSLSAYLRAHGKQSGIMVARPLDPSSPLH